MRNKENIKELMDALRTSTEREIHFDEEAIVSVYQKKETDQSLAIKILSIFGGILACLAFIGFLFLAQIFSSKEGIILFGGICIAGSAVLSRFSKKVITDTLSVSFYVAGFSLLGFGLSSHDNTMQLTFIGIALCVLLLVHNYILSFISVLILNGSILSLIITNDLYDLTYIFITVQALIVTFIFLNEAKIITANRILSGLYDPVCIGMTLSFIAGLGYIGFEDELSIPVLTLYNGLSSAVIILAVLYVVSVLLKKLQVTHSRFKIIIYVLTALILLPTTLSPAISGAILVILLSFLVNNKTGWVLACVALISFIGKLYYDLQFTLLTKSILLFSSGIMFLAIYAFIHKKLISHEKI
ncbi:DUF4401 domain-containing protein [Chryseobacterium vaccae]|uniref:DUF4401 domain-containing protein n=1 Tax=Chryseobacterium vaccae TaxID=2604424 RepID=UPI0012950D6B|nr:DUF4401 domain-containing protein [Chryseobacterium vaccae]